ncbi:MAG TPA: hypothetical protein VMW15_07240 [Terracidiphilus sp.]|nr:hypothetical protein [Terracidiphilus sp.]
MAKRERIYFRVSKGALIPADPYAASVLRERGYHMNDLLAADLMKPRNPKFNRLVHQLGQLVVSNIDAFAGLDAHTAIKRLQIEGKVACDEIGILIPNYGTVIQLIPRSLSYQSMDEGEYQAAARGISRTIAERYWPDTTPEAIERMADCMIQEAA